MAAACEAVEWPSQPLGFESLAPPHGHSILPTILDKLLSGIKIVDAGGG